MQLRIWTATIMFVSGYFPLAMILAVLNFDFEKLEPRNPTAFLVTLWVSGISVIVHIILMKRLSGSYLVEVVEVEDRSPELLNYTVPYIVSFVGQDVLHDLNLSIAMVIFLLLLGAMTVRSRVVLINPLLIFSGYRLYGVTVKSGNTEMTRLLISKSAVSEGGQIKVCTISGSLMFGEALSGS